jgi:P4 family phage/plasmid primase-like protien
MRCIMHGGGVLRGFYDDLEAFEADALALDREKTAKGIYFTLNPVKLELLLRSRNYLSRGDSTKDEDIISRRWLCFDFDPVREKDTNATDAEHALAFERAGEVRKFLSDLGWPEPILADSGNGAHLGYRVDLPNDEASRDLTKGVFQVIADHHSDDFVNVDQSVSNAGRIWKLYGTHARKNTDTDERPQRLAQILDCPNELNIITAEQLKALLPAPQPKDEPSSDNAAKKSGNSFDELKAQLRIILEGYKTKESKIFLYAPGRCHGSTDGTGIWIRKDNNSVGCFKGCSIGNILTAHGLPAHPIETKVHFDTEKQNDSPGESNNSSVNTNTEDDEPLQCSDMGNGYRFARQHGNRARYSEIAGKWFVFDGKQWSEDVTGEAVRLAKKTVKAIYTEAAYTTDEEKRKSIAKHALRSEGDSRITAMLHQAQSELPIRIETFDSDPFLFNCENGTIDLRTGELRPRNREQFLTKLSPVTYDENARATKWETFLHQIFEGDEQLIRFVQKAVGYSLTGSTEEQVFFIGYGTGANGKSVFLKTIAAVVAEYGQQVRTETLMVKRHVGVSNDIACLRGARFLSAVESESDNRLAEATVKQLTGGDTVRARFLFHEEFEFSPQFKIWLAANHKPEIRGTDNAIWRRIRLVPFNVTFPKDKQNPRLDLELREELSGILAWAVRGCLLWQHEGLGETEAVTKATAAYRDEMDSLSEFLDDCCAIGSNYQVTVTEIYNRYETWCQSNGEQAQPAKWLRAQLIDRGIKPARDSTRRFWKGIGLIRNEENEKTDF